MQHQPCLTKSLINMSNEKNFNIILGVNVGVISWKVVCHYGTEFVIHMAIKE